MHPAIPSLPSSAAWWTGRRLGLRIVLLVFQSRQPSPILQGQRPVFPSCSDSVIDLTTALPAPHRRRHQFWFFSLYEKPGLLSLLKPSTTELVFGRAGMHPGVVRCNVPTWTMVPTVWAGFLGASHLPHHRYRAGSSRTGAVVVGGGMRPGWHGLAN